MKRLDLRLQTKTLTRPLPEGEKPADWSSPFLSHPSAFILSSLATSFSLPLRHLIPGRLHAGGDDGVVCHGGRQ